MWQGLMPAADGLIGAAKIGARQACALIVRSVLAHTRNSDGDLCPLELVARRRAWWRASISRFLPNVASLRPEL
jgi:hypothetical protein